MASRPDKGKALVPDDAAAARDTAEPALPDTTEPPHEDREARIREAAYRRYQQRAGDSGDALTDWLEAEKEVGAP
jgi:hypothetical protein